MANNYHNTTNKLYTTKLRVLLSNMPDYCRYFFNAKREVLEIRSEYAYAMDLKVFFEYLAQSRPEYEGTPIKEIPAQVFNELTSHDIDDYLEYLGFYTSNGVERSNEAMGKSRKLACLKSFCKYLMREGIIERNPVEFIDMPKIHDNDIIALTDNQKQRLFEVIDSGENMTKWQKTVHQYCRYRDNAILMTLLGTGIRVSELVGLDISDVDFQNNLIHVIRKGGKKDHVYFSPQVRESLLLYLTPDKTLKGTRAAFDAPGDLTALFVSRKKTRLTVRGVQRVLEEYSRLAFGVLEKDEQTGEEKLVVNKDLKITPHKMRKTFGTELYNQEKDIKVVADTLGHTNVNTAMKHYVATSEENKKRAAINVL